MLKAPKQVRTLDGLFAFSSWTTSNGGLLLVASSTSASTSVTVDTYGTVTANYNVN